MPPVTEDTQAAWASNDYVRITIHVLLITGTIFLIKIAAQMIYMLYLRKRHPEDGRSRLRPRVGLVFDPTSSDMIPNLEIGMERRESRSSVQAQGEVRNNEETPSMSEGLAGPRSESLNAGGVEHYEVPEAIRRSATA
ncbi:MAG: hypothetical protein Q9167_007930 [Letrouitia subvulpina]